VADSGFLSPDEVEAIYEILGQHNVVVPSNWSRRHKAHVEKMRSGGASGVAEVVRNLSLRRKGQDLTPGEARMLNRARQILVLDLAFATGANEVQVEGAIDRLLP
jgi:CarD family transcriptional regulator